MKRQKLAVALLALPLSALLLAGCGGGDKEAAENPEPTQSAEAEGPSVQGPAVREPSDGGESSPAPSDSDEKEDESEGSIKINEGSDEEDEKPSEDASETPDEPNGGKETNYGGTNNPKCEGVVGPIPKSEDGYKKELDADNDGIACEPNDGGTGAEDSEPNDGDSDSSTSDGDSSSDTGSDEATLDASDGTAVLVSIEKDAKIYASPKTDSQVLGDASKGGQFKGTVTEDGKWVKITNTPGYVKADALKIKEKL